MSYTVAIRNNATGEIRLCAQDLDWRCDSSVFWWTEGNFGCDCNRHLEFLRAGGQGPPDDPHWNAADHDCGVTAYCAIYADLPGGERVLLDGQAEPQTETRK